ncbi:MAG: hypothetical protein KDJ75_02635 [Alphaproteobacteria bacterium]|nr:hypothetical protein [Alphaproteobacteria bacterium]
MAQDQNSEQTGTDKKTKLDKAQAVRKSKQKPAVPSQRHGKVFLRRLSIVLFELLAVLILLLAGGSGFLVWRLSRGPVDIGFAADYVQEALRDEQRGIYTVMDRAVLHWPDIRGPLLLRLYGGRVYNADNELIVSVDEAALALSKTGLFAGRVLPEALIIRKPSLKVIRRADNSFDIGLGSGAGEASAAFAGQEADQTDLIERVLSYVARPGRESASTSPLAGLEAFEIDEAKVLVEDLALGVSWSLPRADFLLESLREGFSASTRIELPQAAGRPENAPNPVLESRILFDWDTHNADIRAKMHGFDTRLLAEKIPELKMLGVHDLIFDGNMQVSVGSDLSLKDAAFELSSASGSISSPELSAASVPYTDFHARALYDGLEKRLRVEEVRATLKGVQMEATAELRQEEDTEKITGPVRIEIQAMKQAQIGPLWPAVLEGDNAQEWIVHRLSDGVFHDVYAQGDFRAEKDGQTGEWSFDVDKVLAGFSFEGMNVNYRPPLAPVKNASGKGVFSLDEEQLKINITGAELSGLKVTGADLAFNNIIEAGAGVADLKVQLEGPLKAALDYIAAEPINVQPDMDVKKVEGRTALNVNIGFPTVKDLKVEDVKIAIDGILEDVRFPAVVQTMDVTGGPFALSVQGNDFTLKGSGALEGRPLTLEYQEFLSSKGQPYTSRIKASLAADADLRMKLGMDLSDFLDGSAGVSLVYTQLGAGKAQANVSVDLTPTRLFIKPFDYEKKPGLKASTTLTAHLKNGILQKITGLQGSAPDFKLEPSVLSFREQGERTVLSQVDVSRFVLGETVAGLDLEFENSGRVKAVLEGPFLDLRPFLSDEGEDKSEPYNEPPLLLSVAVDRMRTDDEENVQYAKIYADIDREGKFNQLEMDAIAGKGDVYLRYKSDSSGKRVFRLEADDAGATLKAFGVYDNIIGGRLVIYGEPIRGIFDRNLRGVAEIRDFKVVKAPGLARLLGAMSLPGLIDLLGDEGITFAKLEAQFDWMYRRQGSLLVLKDGRTSGNALGLTFDGTFDNAAGTLNVSGTLIPLSGLNAVIGSIPLVGEILTGGSGGVFAATYKVKGDAKDPDISVNPLAVLAPGILRRILFE